MHASYVTYVSLWLPYTSYQFDSDEVGFYGATSASFFN